MRSVCCGGKRKLPWQFTVVIKCDPVASGGIIGSAGFVAEVSKREKAAFPRERKTPPLEVGVGGKALFALRWLNKLRK